MPRKKSYVPYLSLHKASGQAIARFNGKVRYFGKWGSQEAQESFARALMEWTVNGNTNGEDDQASITIRELVDRYLAWAETYYHSKNAVRTINAALRHLKPFYPEKAKDLRPRHLKTIQRSMIASTNPRGTKYTRGTVNSYIAAIKRVYRWGAEEELVPVTVAQTLREVSYLVRGRSEAIESTPIGPVAWDTVNETIKHLAPKPARIILLMWWTGMRPGEACALHAREIDRSDDVWIYRPAAHKTAHHGRTRVIAIGPEAQKLIDPILRVRPFDYLFPGCNGRDFYSPNTLSRSVLLACMANNIAHWHPHQLRHAAATRIAHALGGSGLDGIEAAKAILGHKGFDVTKIYAERDIALAKRVMSQLG